MNYFVLRFVNKMEKNFHFGEGTDVFLSEQNKIF